MESQNENQKSIADLTMNLQVGQDTNQNNVIIGDPLQNIQPQIQQQSVSSSNSIPVQQNQITSTPTNVSSNASVISEVASIYGDDDQIEVKEIVKKTETQTYNLHDNLSLNIKTNKSKLRLSEVRDVNIPVHVSFKTEDINFSLEDRSSIDLVCVIDKSSSMSGEKI